MALVAPVAPPGFAEQKTEASLSNASPTANAVPSPIVMLNHPQRLADTRTLGAGPIATGSTRCFAAAGLLGIPADAGAVVLNVTAVSHTMNGWLAVFPNGQPVPGTSTLNFATSEYAIANGAIMRVGSGGQVCVNVGSGPGVQGSSHVILDATGYLPASALAQLAMLPSPVRLTDTRGGGGAIASGQSRCFTVAGILGIPADAAAIVLNVTAVGYPTNGWLTAYPNGQSVPNTSTLNFDQSEYAIANNALMRVGSGGQICVNVGTGAGVPGSSQVILDASGYFTGGSVDAVPMLSTPQRLLDTRLSGGSIASGSTRCFPVAGMVGIPATATGVLLNLTAVGYGVPGWLTALPMGQATPATSTLNFDRTEYAIANAGIMRTGNSGDVCVNVGTAGGAQGSSDVIVDVVGYLPSVPAATDIFNSAPTLVPPAVGMGDTAGASLETGERQSTCDAPIDRSVWYRITAPSPGTLFVNTRQDNYPSLTLWSGSALQNLTQVACNNPWVSASGDLTVPIQAGQTYFLQVGRLGSFGGAPETFILDVHLDETGLPDLAPVLNQVTDLWMVERPLDAPVEVQNRGAGVAPASKLEFFFDAANPPNSGNVPVLTVDVPSLAPGATTAVNGTIASGNLAVGSHALSVQTDRRAAVSESDETNNVDGPAQILFGHEPPNDTFSGAIRLAIPSTTTASNLFAYAPFFFVRQCGNNTLYIGRQLLYTMVPTTTGSVSLTITQTNFDTVVEVSNQSRPFDPVSCSLTTVRQPGVPMTIPVTAGQTYLIRVSSWLATSEGGTFTLDIR